MHKYTKYIAVIGMFLLLSCSDLSSFCKHAIRFPGFKPGIPEISSVPVQSALLKKGEEINLPTEPSTPPTPIRISWDRLKDVTYKQEFNEEYQLDFMYPVFGNDIRKLEGKEVIIAGYMVPLNVKAGMYAISRYTFAACFFCGAAGVESVISLKFKNKSRRFRTDEYLTIQGKLELNSKNVNDFIYIFRDAEAL